MPKAITELGLTYFRIRSLDSQNEILKSTVISRQADVEIVTARYKAGLVNETDVSRAKNQLAMAQAELSQKLLERAKDENLLAALLGFYASEYSLCPMPLRVLPPVVAPSLPAELLQRRPDVQEAERIMAEQNARIGIAKAQYFPEVVLTGAIGVASPSISSLFDWQARLWLWAIQATQLVFDAGRTSAVNSEAQALFLQAVAEYTKTTIKAFQEAESALAAEKYTKEEFFHYQTASEAASDTKVVSQERYVKGLYNYLEVEDANRQLLSSQLLMERSRFECFQATILLVKALGGSFSEE